MSKTYTLEELRQMRSRSDPHRFRETAEKDIQEQSIADPDTPWLTDDELDEFSEPQQRRRRNDNEES